VDALSEENICAFLERMPPSRREQRKMEATGMRRLRAYLEVEAGLFTSPSCAVVLAADQIGEEFAIYLRQERGLAENSVRAYMLPLRGFLAEFVDRDGDFSPSRLDASSIQDSLINRIPQLSVSCSRLLVATLRCFLRFLFHKGHVELDLSVSVPAFRGHRHIIPAFLTPEQVENVLSTPDRTTLKGLRDFAVLLLLARLGLRAFEVVNLELDDIRWREGKLIIRGKGRVFESLPLLSEVGEAIADYLRDGRPETTSRRVFIRRHAPRTAFSGPSAVGAIVRLALSRSGMKPPGRGAAHLFRHSLATQMIRSGASIAEIAQVLRHRAAGSTEIYAQVAFESLREVARAWPTTTGGAL
jgi:site-specific recombinase XerD